MLEEVSTTPSTESLMRCTPLGHTSTTATHCCCVRSGINSAAVSASVNAIAKVGSTAASSCLNSCSCSVTIASTALSAASGIAITATASRGIAFAKEPPVSSAIRTPCFSSCTIVRMNNLMALPRPR